MAWILLLKGTSFSVKIKNEDLIEDILENVLENNTNYKKLEEYANIQKLVLNHSYDDENIFTIFCGFDLYNERHMYNGKTVTCSLKEYNLETLNRLTLDLKTFLKQTFPDLTFKEKNGIILNQFD